MKARQIDIQFDTETADPDDFFALCFLASHPAAHLRAVTINPGTRAQVGALRHALDRLGLNDVAVGARNPDSRKNCLSGFLGRLFGPVAPADPDDLAHNVLAECLAKYPDATLVTGAPLHNLARFLKEHPDGIIRRWVGQGGFAGDNIVPPEHRLRKFDGMDTCPTFNFGGHPRGALAMLSSERVLRRELVSKNVCHGVVYDQAMHERVEPLRQATAGLELMYGGMELYLQRHRGGKKFHDPLAACVAMEPDIVTFVEVELYREQGEWGSRRAEGTNTFISIAVDKERFFETLTSH